MSVDHSSSPHDDLPQTSSSSSNFSFCGDSLYVSFCFTSIVLLLPLSVFVLYLGFQRWIQRRSSAAPMSHCDFLTYNMAVTELIGVFGNTFSICASFVLVDLKWVGYHVETYLWSARMLFPILSCVERYLAVVHPITYLRLRRGGGVRLRNICTAYIWLQGCAGHGLILLMQSSTVSSLLILSAAQMIIFLITMLFCSLSVLYVLIRPRPGEVGGNRWRIHQSKQRALRSILIIMGVLFLRFAGGLVCNVLIYTQTESSTLFCLITTTSGWLSLPGSLVLLLLFLHRAGRLPGWRQTPQSGRGLHPRVCC